MHISILFASALHKAAQAVLSSETSLTLYFKTATIFDEHLDLQPECLELLQLQCSSTGGGKPRACPRYLSTPQGSGQQTH